MRFWPPRLRRREGSEPAQTPLILCDYVDRVALDEVAEQLEVRLAAQTQLAEKTMSSSAVSGAPHGIGLKRSRGSESGVTSTYDAATAAARVSAIDRRLRESHELTDFIAEVAGAEWVALARPGHGFEIDLPSNPPLGESVVA